MPAMFARTDGYEAMMGRWSMRLANFTGFDDYWLPFTMGPGPQGIYVESLSSDSRTALRDQLRRRLLGDGPDGPFSLGARAWAVRGMVPGP